MTDSARPGGGTVAGGGPSPRDPGEVLALRSQLGVGGETPRLRDLNATVALGNVRAGHGIRVAISGAPQYVAAGGLGGGGGGGGTTVKGSVDVHGAGLFRALPAGSGALAQMLLPLTLYFEREEWARFARALPENKRGQRGPGGARDRANLSFTLGARQLSHATLLSTLRSIATAGGDPVFVFELRGPCGGGGGGGQVEAGSLLGYLPTRCSEILAGLGEDDATAESDETPGAGAAGAHGANAASVGAGATPRIRYEGPLPVFRRSWARRAVGWARWWLCGLLFAAGCWAMVLLDDAAPLLAATPPVFGNMTGITSLRSVLPPHPANWTAAFALGELRRELLAAEAAADDVTAVLASAATWTGRTVSAEQLRDMPLVIAELEAQIGVVARVTGVFTFVNTMWAFAILGIAVSIGPSLYHLLKPIRQWLKRQIEWCFKRIVKPVALRLHRWGVFELAAFAICYLVVLQGFRQDPGSGLFVSLTGAALAVPSMAYSTLLRGQRCSGEMLSQAGYSWLVMCWAPLAVAYESTFLGYITVAAFWSAIGFGVIAHPLCLCIGFRSEETMKFACAVSSTVTTVFVAAHVTAGSPRWLAPFASGISVLGNVVTFLSLLIMSSAYYTPRRQSSPWTARWFTANAVMVIALVVAQAVGMVFGLPGMAHVGSVFTVLWVIDKYAEWHSENELNGWVLLLILSLAVWRLSLALHDYPQYVTALFDAF